MKHRIETGPQECPECTAPHGGPWQRYEHVRAQQSALWAAAVEAFGPEPIAEVLDHAGHGCDCQLMDELSEALELAQIGKTNV